MSAKREDERAVGHGFDVVGEVAFEQKKLSFMHLCDPFGEMEAPRGRLRVGSRPT